MKQIFSEIRKPSDNSIRHLWRFLPVVLGIAGLVCISGVEGKAQKTSLLRQSVGDNDSIGDGTNTVENTNAETPVFSADLDAPTDNGAASNDLVLPANSAVSGRTAVVSNSNNNLRSTSRLRENPVGELDANGQFDSRGNRPAVPVEGGGAVSTSNPYAATGLRLGTFDLFPTLEQSVGYSSNADEDENGAASGYSQTSVGLRLRSNWTIHQFEAELGATYQRFFNGQSENLPTANANASLRLDVGREYTVTVNGAYDLTTESASSANLVTGRTATISDRPNVEALSSSLELARTAGRLRFLLRGSLVKTRYQDATLSDGTKLLQGDRDNLLSSGTVRLSFQTSPAVSPFVEASIGKRIFDIKVDSNGNRRDGITTALRGGLELDFGEKLTGQLALSYAVEEFDDDNISSLGGLTIDGSLAWSPLRLTTITATASTTLIGSSNINDNGSILYSGTLGISRLVRPQLTLDANLTAALQEYDTSGRRDVTLGVNAGYTYWFNHFLAATGRVSYQTVDSTETGSSYDVGTVIIGLRFQR